MRKLLTLGLLIGTGCLAGTDPDFGGNWPVHAVNVSGAVVFGGRTQVQGGSVQVLLTLANQRTDSARVEHGACSFAVLAEGPGRVTWDNRLPPGGACIDILLVVLLGPRESKELVVLGVPSRTILGDSLPVGVYRFSIFYRLGDGGLQALDAGEAQLSAAG